MRWDKKRLAGRRKVRRVIEITEGICTGSTWRVNFLWTMSSWPIGIDDRQGGGDGPEGWIRKR
jgi:hypothetical protein